MFDLTAGRATHIPSHAGIPVVVSGTVQAAAIGLLVVLPALFVAEQLPQVPTMLAFVAALPPPPPPPPPPAPAKPKPPSEVRPSRIDRELVAPLEEPSKIAPLPDDEGVDFGVPGGVEGGIPGGVIGGVVGGLPEPPPPPPPPPARERGPIRVGGQINPPQLVRRVEPDYPQYAVDARLHGVVILEAIVDEEGKVVDVKVLRSAHKLLDRQAEMAVRQWRYSPLVLNGTRERFVLTVTLAFRLDQLE
jgi:protein TonB